MQLTLIEAQACLAVSGVWSVCILAMWLHDRRWDARHIAAGFILMLMVACAFWVAWVLYSAAAVVWEAYAWTF
jgi:hypothetical protein